MIQIVMVNLIVLTILHYKNIVNTIDDEINKNADLNDDGKINTADIVY